MHSETVRSLFSTKTKDFITAVDEKNIILVKEVKPGETYDDLRKDSHIDRRYAQYRVTDTCQRGIRYDRQRDQGRIAFL